MRTKTILLSGVVAALSSASLMAQVYSLNAVGYINVTCAAQSFTIVSDQLWANGQGVNQYISPTLDSQLLTTANVGVTVYGYSASGGNVTAFNVVSGPAWSSPGVSSSPVALINPGIAFFLYNPSATPLVLTFVGTVGQGATVNPLGNGELNLVSSMWPATGAIDSVLGLVPGNGDVVLVPNGSGGYNANNYNNGWSSAGGAPNIPVGNGFFYYNANLSTVNNWNQNFSVQ